MKKFDPLLVLFAFLFPVMANATELPDEFLTRCLVPMVEADPFVSAGLVGPSSLPNADIGVEGVAAQRQSWQFPEKNWTLGTMMAGDAQITVARACGITVSGFQGADSTVVAKVMKAIGLTAEVCQFELDAAGVFGFRSVVQNTKRGLPILVNFSPLDDGSHVLMAWEVSPDVASSPCRR